MRESMINNNLWNMFWKAWEHSDPFANRVIIFFTIIMLFLLVLNLQRKTGNKSEYTTLGMLGTFIGIFYGLLYFNADDIINSLPKLLGGLQLAFATSILGLMASIFHEWVSRGWELNTENDPTNNLLKKIAENVQALGKDGEDTLLGQFKMLRVDFRDFAQRVAETSSQAATKAIIEALTDVIKNFNIKITEQFGENFKHLNESVGKLLEWQSEYKDYMEGYRENLDLLSSSIEENSRSVATLPDIVAQIYNTVNVTDNELKKLTETTNALQDFSKKLGSAIPQIISSVEDLTNEAQQQTIKITQETTETLQKISQEVIKMNTNLSYKTINQIETISKSTTDSLKDLDTQTKQTIPSVKKTLDDVIGNTDEQLEVIGRHIVSIVQKLVEDFDNLSRTLQHIPTTKNENGGR